MIRAIRIIGAIKEISLKGFRLIKVCTLVRLFVKTIKPIPVKAAAQVAQEPVKAIVKPDNNRNNELRAMSNGLEEDRIPIIMKGTSKAKIAAVEKEEPLGVKFKAFTQGAGNSLMPA